jgi:hypothetical protein
MEKSKYWWEIGTFQNGCCGVVSITSMQYINRAYLNGCVDDSKNILVRTKEILENVSEGLGYRDGSIAVTAVTSSETPKKWVEYYETSGEWEKLFEFVNTKTGNLCTMWKTEIEFTEDDFNEEDEDW